MRSRKFRDAESRGISQPIWAAKASMIVQVVVARVVVDECMKREWQQRVFAAFLSGRELC